MLHVDDWLDDPSNSETFAKEFLEHYRRPAVDKDRQWLESNPLFCDYNGKRYRCTGCSRMGDVWLTENYQQAVGYQKRVDITLCSNWGKEV